MSPWVEVVLVSLKEIGQANDKLTGSYNVSGSGNGISSAFELTDGILSRFERLKHARAI
jgi:hypothetical protein